MLALLLTFFANANSQTVGNTGWTMLETTWNINAFAGFYPVPLTESEAKNKKWVPMMKCGDSTSPGNLYSDAGDLSAMPFYNADGQISGLILGMLNPGASSETSSQPFVQYHLKNGTKFWGIQANFRNPSTTCESGKGGNEKIGDRLWFAQRSQSSFYKAPLNQSKEALESNGWVYGACFWQMGYHWWRYITVNENCNDMYPIFLLYNNNKLNAWGIAMAHEDRPKLTSFRWEHPGGSELNNFFQPGTIPACLPKQGTLSTMHIFMTNPAYDLCPIIE
eukprot:133683_1